MSGKFSIVIFYAIGILLLVLGAITAYINLTSGLLFILSGVLILPVTWNRVSRFFSIPVFNQARIPAVLALVIISSVLAGVSLKGGLQQQFDATDYHNYMVELDRQLEPASADYARGVRIENLPEPGDMQIGNYYALIIGIDRYSGDWSPLENAVNDAKAVEAVLREKYVFHHIKTLYDQQATRGNIITEFEWLVNNVKENDNVLIYYSGHGEFWDKVNKGYWIPVDAKTRSTSGYVSNLDIKAYIGGINSKHTLLISDACFSGDIFRGKTETIQFEDSEKYYKTVHNKPSRQAISSGGLEPVMDAGSDGHSVFTNYLIGALENNGKKFLDAGELYNQIRIPVVNNSRQTPIFAPIKDTGDEGGQFIFISKTSG